MTRSGALAQLASMAMRSNVLVEYAPAKFLVTSELLYGGPETQVAAFTRLRPGAGFDEAASAPIERHVFPAVKMHSDGSRWPAWLQVFGYFVDERS